MRGRGGGGGGPDEEVAVVAAGFIGFRVAEPVGGAVRGGEEAHFLDRGSLLFLFTFPFLSVLLVNRGKRLCCK